MRGRIEDLRWMAVAALLLAVALPAAADQGEADQGEVDFNRDIRPILSANCLTCHGPDQETREAGLRLDTRAGALADLGGGFAAIVPGDPDESELIYRVTEDSDRHVMPPPDVGDRLSDEQIDTLRRWIEQGAEYADHWSYVKPQRPQLPETEDADWSRNPIDAFIIQRLEEEGLSPSPEADRHTLIRRAWLTMTGLPPTPDQVQQFVDDDAPGAYGRMVERAMEQPTYGEHWARYWLDKARYADSTGYAEDRPREIWGYRDWVIRAFNAHMPFDQFTIEQIGGDLIEAPTESQLIATAFHRNTQTNVEGGIDPEEFRNAAVVDRVNTTFEVWMGTTMSCAQCHTHKYDPITLEEYFQAFAIFNQTEDHNRRDETPVHAFFTPGENPDQQKRHTVPIMQDLAEAERRTTYIQFRGNFLDTGPEVRPGVPEAFHDLEIEGEPDRLDLAHWLISEENPLTARVIVNRLWQEIFGTGLVATSEEFGSQGDLPSHPDLLDWLAVEFMESGWDMQHMKRLMLTSAAFRQSSAVTDEHLRYDADNRLLSRGPRQRLVAEAIRDQALFAGGLLSSKMYGPPVHPPQPLSGLATAFGSGVDWETSEGEDRYRRGLYTMWRRTVPYPSMTTFDAPNRETCTVRREHTNTPLQALVTLNDEVFIEAAQGLARRMAAAADDPAERARHGFRLVLSRQPEQSELDTLLDLHRDAHARYADVPEQAQAMATDPLGPLPEGMETTDLAAWTVVANVLLNLDETLMPR